MASAAGIHIDHNSFRLIAIEGSPKKHKVVATIEGEVLPGEDPVVAVAEALKKGAKKNKLNVETVGLVVDSGLAAFRELSLPFDDEAKIEEVLKFEIESELPQWNIDDVIVDYVTLRTKPGVQSDLLVTALPKDRLQLQIDACEAAGLEPNEAELDGTALFNAAKGAGLLKEDAAQLLVHVGDATCALVLVDGGVMTAMRAIRAGAHTASVAKTDVAKTEDDDAEVTEAVAEESEAQAARQAKIAQRVRREIMRTLSGAKLENTFDEVLLCGHRLPGLEQESFDGVQARVIELSVPGAEGALNPEFIVAYGTALRELGSDALKPHLRREELSYSGKFERLELPLAVLGLLLVTTLAVSFIITKKKLDWHENNMATWMQASNNFLFPIPASSYPGRLKNPPKEILSFATKAARGEITTLTGYEQLVRMRDLLRDEKSRLEIEVGTKTDYEQPLSALSGLMLVMSAIDEMGDNIGRYAFRRVVATYVQGRGNATEDLIQVKLDMDFHAADSTEATESFTYMKRAFEDTAKRPWSREFKSTIASKPFENGKGLTVDGITIMVNPKLAAGS